MYKLLTTNYFVFLNLCLLILLTIFSKNSAYADNGFIQEGDQLAALVTQVHKQTPANHHPVNVPANTIASLLSALHIKIPSSGNRANDENRFFTESEIAFLGQALSNMLSIAHSKQDIIFRTRSRRANLANFTSKQGRAFWHNNKLHIVLAENSPSTSNTEKSRHISFTFITSNAVTQEIDFNDIRDPNWASIDANQLLGYTATPESFANDNLNTNLSHEEKLRKLSSSNKKAYYQNKLINKRYIKFLMKQTQKQHQISKNL